MASSSSVNLKALGLNFSPNALELPPGSLVEADNIIIRRDDVIESRRGFKLFGEEMPSQEKAKQLLVYRDRILRHYGSKLAFQDGENSEGVAQFTEFAGTYSETQDGLRIKGVQEKNGNFYFTTSSGIKKISAASGSELSPESGYITAAGGIKALDLEAKFRLPTGTETGFLPPNSVTSYKLVWGKTDANNVEVLGRPSEEVIVYNPLRTLLVLNLNNLLYILDKFTASNALFKYDSTKSLFSTLAAKSDVDASELRQKLVDLAKKLDEDEVFASDTGTNDIFKPLDINSVTANYGVITTTITNRTFTFSTANVSISNNTITKPNNRLSTGQAIKFTTTTTLPDPLDAEAIYYVVKVTPDVFKVSTTSDGLNIVDITTTGEGTITTTGTPSKYFSTDLASSKNINVYLDKFKSNGIDIDNLNGAQEIQTVSDFPTNQITFTARGYSASGSVGISGGITEIPITKPASSNIVIDSSTDIFSYKTITATTTTNSVTITNTGHSLVNNDIIVITSGAGDFTAGDYYVVNSVKGVSFELSKEPGGFSINQTGSGSITFRLKYIFNENEKIKFTKTLGSWPNYRLSGQITRVTPGNPVIITSVNHGLSTGDNIEILGTNTNLPINTGSSPLPATRQITKLDDDTFTVAVNVTSVTSGIGVWYKTVSLGDSGSYYAISTSAGQGFKIALTSGGTPLDMQTGWTGSGLSARKINVIPITTSGSHGLKDSQNVIIANSSSYPNINGTYKITVISDDKFSIEKDIEIQTAGTSGQWNILIDTIGTIQSNKYRLLTEPETPDETDFTGTGKVLFSYQTYLDLIINTLRSEDANIIDKTAAKNIGLTDFEQKSSGVVDLKFTVPKEIDSSYYYQLYRSSYFQVGSDSVTSLEQAEPQTDFTLLKQDYYTTTGKVLSITDDQPEEFLIGAFLYTNTGETGNDYPPIAKDIASFKNKTFYANTKIKQQFLLELIGVAQLKDEIAAEKTPKLLFADSSGSNTCEVSFVLAAKEVSTIASPPAASSTAIYFDINSANDETKYRFWYGTDVAPTPNSNGKTLVRVNIGTSLSLSGTIEGNTKASPTVITSTNHKLTTGQTITITGSNSTPSIDGTYVVTVTGTNTFTIPVKVTAVGTTGSWSIAPKSRAQIIADTVNLYITDFEADVYYSNILVNSNTNTVNCLNSFAVGDKVEFIGKYLPDGIAENIEYFILETGLTTNQFKIALNEDETPITFTSSGNGFVKKVSGPSLVTNNNVVITNAKDGACLQPNIILSQLTAITGIVTGSPTTITSPNHGLSTGSSITITGSSNSSINGTHVITVTGTNTFTIPVATLSASSPYGSWSRAVTQKLGVGESITNKQVAIPSSDLIDPATQAELTIKSLIRVVNRNTVLNSTFDTYCYFVDYPGVLLFEGTDFTDNISYPLANSADVGASFSPDISPSSVNGTGISTSGLASDVTLIFESAHGFLNGDSIVIIDSNSTPSIDGVYTVEYVSSTRLKIYPSVAVTASGTSFKFINTFESEQSSNFFKKNSLYYSKFNQPEAVSQENYILIGSEEKEILRIFPLRDSLFVFKEDGLYRVTADYSPPSQVLFDSSCILNAPDSVAVSNNNIFCWTTQGIQYVNESGATLISRPIDTEVFKLASAQYGGFKTATFGVGYESDNSYLVWTVKNLTDTVATQAFRFSSVTGTWTKYQKTNTCGIVKAQDDKLYLGAGDVEYIEQERKEFKREDYADREYTFNISQSAWLQNKKIKLQTVENIKVGDVITQTQRLTIYQFNSLLRKLDKDPSIEAYYNSIPSTPNFYSSLVAKYGDNLREKIVALAKKLDLISNLTISSGTISNILVANPTQVTSANHNLSTGDSITITGSNSTPSINGTYAVTVTDVNTFTIPVNVTGAGNAGSWLKQSKVIAQNNFEATIQTTAKTIGSISYSSPATITTTAPHGLFTGRKVTISGVTSVPSVNDLFTVTVTGSNTFTIPKTLISFSSLPAGIVTPADSDFDDIKVCFNKIIQKLNSDTSLVFSNYNEVITSAKQEAVIVDIDRILNIITLDKQLDFVVGPVTIYNAIPCSFVYSPSSMGDALMLKHFSQATMLFANKGFSSATLRFATDLLPSFIEVDFEGDGAGAFGNDNFGDKFFGGGSNYIPFRTYIPRPCQRCRYLTVGFSHHTAREQFNIFGLTLTGRAVSGRAYR